MTPRFDTWESYFYPETIDPATGYGTLRNLYGERDARVLARLEYVETSGRAQQIDNGTITIARTYDGDHMRAIHWHLFQDVYEWAGQYRRVNIFKGPDRSFGDVLTGELDRYLHDIHQLITHTPWRWRNAWAQYRTVPGLRRGDPEGDLHDQRHRVHQREVPPGRAGPWALPQRASRVEVPVPSDPLP